MASMIFDEWTGPMNEILYYICIGLGLSALGAAWYYALDCAYETIKNWPHRNGN